MTMLDAPTLLDAAAVVPPDDVIDQPDWLRELRQQASGVFNRVGFPGRRDEDWRFTNTQPITTTAYASPPEVAPELAPGLLDQYRIPDVDVVRLVFVDGSYSAELSDDLDSLGEGVTCELVQDWSADTPATAAARDKLGKLSRTHEDAFTALNTARLGPTLVVHVAQAVKAVKPLCVLCVGGAIDEPVAAHPRNLIIAEADAQLTFLEHYITARPDAVYFNNGVTELFAGARAIVHHYLLERESEAAFNISSLMIQQQTQSDVHSHTVLLGGRIVRNNVMPTLAGEDCHCLINGLYVAHGQQHLDNAMRVRHAAPNCRSRQYYKGIMNDSSRGVFTGRIIVDEAGQQTDAVQTNRNMLLSDDARVNARPQLEIYADDVKCTHGATTGRVDEDAVFYFRSRGLPEPVARAMLIYAFAAEGFGRMELQPVRQLLAEEMIAKLPRAQGLSIEV
jgi:Fe-S cluster assembly protein SufD